MNGCHISIDISLDYKRSAFLGRYVISTIWMSSGGIKLRIENSIQPIISSDHPHKDMAYVPRHRITSSCSTHIIQQWSTLYLSLRKLFHMLPGVVPSCFRSCGGGIEWAFITSSISFLAPSGTSSSSKRPRILSRSAKKGSQISPTATAAKVPNVTTVTSFFPSTRGMFVSLFAVSVRKCTFMDDLLEIESTTTQQRTAYDTTLVYCIVWRMYRTERTVCTVHFFVIADVRRSKKLSKYARHAKKSSTTKSSFFVYLF